MGYDVVWTVVAASDVAAPHRRKRLFVLGVRDGLPARDGLPVAVLDGQRWVTPGEGLFGPVPFRGRIPDHGIMTGGRIHRSVAPVPGAARLLLPSPAAHDSGNTPENHLRKKPGRQQVTSLQVIADHGLLATGGMLRTPTAQLAVNGGSQHPDKRKAGGHGPTLADEIEHEIPGGGCRQPTPAARDFRSGKSNIMDRNARPLNEVIEHLPTPGAKLAADSQTHRSGERTSELLLTGIAQELGRSLPTPQASDWKGSGAAQGRSRRDNGRPYGPGDADLPEAVEYLPTPRATDGTKGGPNQRGSSGGLMLPSADGGRQHEVSDDEGDLEAVVIAISGRRRKDRAGHGQLILPGTALAQPPRLVSLSPTAEAWGKYAPGIARWETVLGRVAPPPTQPGRDGKPRLSPAAVEFLMGIPEGWVTGVPGLSRSQMLAALGNGVVPLQAVLALRLLLEVSNVRAVQASAHQALRDMRCSAGAQAV